MSETVITVQGTASDWFDAERATLSIQVAHDGPRRAPVYEATTTVAADIASALSALDGDDLSRWSSDRMSVSSQRPWTNDGTQLPPVYRAAISITARFRDFDALAAFVERFATTEGVQVQGIDWSLTEQKQLDVIRDVQTRAVEDATRKATTYARAVGLNTVTPLAIADPGMLGDAACTETSFGGPMLRGSARMAAADASGPGLELTPDRIPVSATIDARFLAR